MLAFAALWLGGVGSTVVCLALAQAALQADRPALTWPSLILVGVFALGPGLFTLPLWVEAQQARLLLLKLLFMSILSAFQFTA